MKTFNEAIKIACDLIEPKELTWTPATREYVRGICELIADLYPHDQFTPERAQTIARLIGITHDLYRADEGEEN